MVNAVLLDRGGSRASLSYASAVSIYSHNSEDVQHQVTRDLVDPFETADRG